jgi:hypothetical protein
MGTVMIQASRNAAAGVLRGENALSSARREARHRRKVGAALWVTQGLLALVFLFAGSMKLVVPPEVLATMSPLPVLFLKLIGLAEVLGAIGLILPALTRVRPGLTPLAGACLGVEMIGATATTLAIGGGVTALMPFVVGVLAAFVAYGRWYVARQPARSGRRQDAARVSPVAQGAR